MNYIENTLERYNKKEKSVFLIGDFNTDLLKIETCSYSHNFLTTLQSCYLLPTIDKPTRVYNTSATLIDNIFTNIPEKLTCSGNIISDISDHFSQFCIFSATKVKVKIKKRKTRYLSQTIINNFVKDLSESEFTEYSADLFFNNNNNIDALFSLFYRKINDLVNKHAPMKFLSNRRLKQLQKPWITQGIRTSIKVKNQLFSSGDTDKYKYYRNELCHLIRISKKLYFNNYFDFNIQNMKRTWIGINTLMNNNKKRSSTISRLKDLNNNEKLEFDCKNVSNIINTHFATIGPKLAGKIPLSNKNFTDYLKNIDLKDSFFFIPVTKQEIETEISALPKNKSYGLYSCPIDLLKASRYIISDHLAYLLNTSINTGMYPSKLKLSKIIPIFKSDDDSDPSNYRPIALLSVFNRIFEKLIYKRLIVFIDKHDLFFESQYGFRKKYSTQHAILDIISTIQSNLDQKLFSCAIFLDLSKAFDTVDHNILLNKLYYYGFRGIIYDWFRSYLSERTQTTSVGSCISNKKQMMCGVPQGSVLGPLLFLLYINDISMASKVFKFHLFVDDTNILYADKSVKSLETVVNEELKKLHQWFTANKLTLNLKKSNFVIFSHYRKKVSAVNIKIFDNSQNKFISLERKKYVKYLGLLIDENLSWKPHIDFICNKVSKIVGLLAKLRHFIPLHTLKTLYRSLIQPYIVYGLSAWGQACKTHLNKILVLQKRALRIIHFIDSRESAIPLFYKTNFLPINFLYLQCISNLMYDVVNQNAPSNICKLFYSISSIHSYNTRSSHSHNLYTQYSRTNLQKNSFSRVGVKLWNEIPNSITFSTKSSFKKNVSQCLHSNLIRYGYDVEISKLFGFT